MNDQDNTATTNIEEQVPEQEQQYNDYYWYKSNSTTLPKKDLLKSLDSNLEDYLRYRHINMNDPVLRGAINEEFEAQKEAIRKDYISTGASGLTRYNANKYTPHEPVYKNNKTGEYITKEKYDALDDKKKEKHYTPFSVDNVIDGLLKSVTKAGYNYLYRDKKEEEKTKFDPNIHGFGAAGHNLANYLTGDVESFIKAFDTCDKKSNKYTINGRLKWLKGELDNYMNSDTYKNLKDLDFEGTEDIKYYLKSYQENINNLKDALYEEDPNINKIILSLQGLGLNGKQIKPYFSDTLPVSGAGGSGGDPNFPGNAGAAGSSANNNEEENKDKLTDDETKVLNELTGKPSYKAKKDGGTAYHFTRHKLPGDRTIYCDNGKYIEGNKSVYMNDVDYCIDENEYEQRKGNNKNKFEKTFLFDAIKKNFSGKKDEKNFTDCACSLGADFFDDDFIDKYYDLIKKNINTNDDDFTTLLYYLYAVKCYDPDDDYNLFYDLNNYQDIVIGSYNSDNGTVLIFDKNKKYLYRQNLYRALENSKKLDGSAKSLKQVAKWLINRNNEENTAYRGIDSMSDTQNKKHGGALNRVAYLQPGNNFPGEGVNKEKPGDNIPGKGVNEEKDKNKKNKENSGNNRPFGDGETEEYTVGFTPQDMARLAAAGMDLTSMIAVLLPGWGTAAAAVADIGSLGTNLWADISDKNVSGWQAAGNFGARAGLSLLGLIPALGEWGNFAKLGRSLRPILPKLLKWANIALIGGAVSTALNMPEIAESLANIGRVFDGQKGWKDISSKDLMNVLYAIQIALGGGRALGVKKAHANFNTKRKQALETALTDKNKDVYVKGESTENYPSYYKLDKSTKNKLEENYKEGNLKEINEQLNKLEDMPKLELEPVRTIKPKRWGLLTEKVELISPSGLVAPIDKPKTLHNITHLYQNKLIKEHNKAINNPMTNSATFKQGSQLSSFNIGGALAGEEVGKYVGGAQIYFDNPDERINRILKKKIVKADDGTKIYGKESIDYSDKDYIGGEYNNKENVDLSVIYKNDNSKTKNSEIKSNRDKEESYKNGQERLNLSRKSYWSENESNSHRVKDFLTWADNYAKNNSNDININGLLDAYNKNVENIYVMFSTISSKPENERYLTDDIVSTGNKSHKDIYSGMNESSNIGYEKEFEKTFGSATSKRAIDRTEQEIELDLSDLSNIEDEELKQLLDKYKFVKDKNGYIYATAKNATDKPTEESGGNATDKPTEVPVENTTDKHTKESESDNNKTFGKLNLSEIIPDLAQLSKLAGTFIVNNKNANDKYPYTLYNPLERYRWIYGDQAAINRGYQAAGIYNHVANQPFTTDAMQQMAARMENLSKGFDVITNGYTVNDKQVATTREYNEKQNKANQQSRYDTSTKNMENIIQSRFTDVVNEQQARNAKYQGVNNFIDYYANKFAQKNEDYEKVRNSYKSMMYKNDALNNPQKYGLNLSEDELSLLRQVASGQKSVYSLTEKEEEAYYMANSKLNNAILQYRVRTEYGLNVPIVEQENGSSSLFDSMWTIEDNTKSKKQGGKLDNETKLEIQRMKNKIKNVEIMQKHYKDKLNHYEKSMDRAMKSANDYIKGMRK